MSEECRAENCKAKHPHKRFCVHGHDTFGAGRSLNSRCYECRREYMRERRANDPEMRKYRREYIRERRTNDPEFRGRELRARRRREIQRYWSDHEYRFGERRRKREQHSPHIWTASKEAV